MMTFECGETGGSLRKSPESVDVGWFSAEETVEMVDHPAQIMKLRDGLKGDRVIYRAYTTKQFEVISTAQV